MTEDNPIVYVMILQNYHILGETVVIYCELFLSKLCKELFLAFSCLLYLDNFDFFKFRFCSDHGEIVSVCL